MLKTKFKTSTRISIIFSIFTFFVVLFLIIFINIFSYFNWEKAEEVERLELKNNYNIEAKYFIEEQFETIELEIFLLFFLTFLAFILSKYLFSKLILQDIFFISEKLKNTNIDTIKKIKINNNKDDEINIIINSINNFLYIIHKNTKNLKEFNSQVSHEFKTPLMVISSELEYLKLNLKQNYLSTAEFSLLEKGKNEFSSLKNSYKKIEKQVDNLNNLLENFLLITRIENSKNIKEEDVYLYNLVQKNLENLEKTYLEKKIKLKNNISKNIKLKTNKILFELIIKNLLENAFKYNKNGGILLIISFYTTGLLFTDNILKIVDSGIGIKKENVEKIWNNFYRENNFGEGYGIGLNLVKKITDILGYKIDVKSEGKNGSEFIIHF